MESTETSGPFLLICVDVPRETEKHQTTEAWLRWQRLLEDAKLWKGQTQGIEKPIENLWLIPIRRALSFATSLIGWCEKYELHYTCYHLGNEPVKCG